MRFERTSTQLLWNLINCIEPEEGITLVDAFHKNITLISLDREGSDTLCKDAKPETEKIFRTEKGIELADTFRKNITLTSKKHRIHFARVPNQKRKENIRRHSLKEHQTNLFGS